ncbi:PilZ domain-containing protein [Sphingopyxis sp. JAI128]|uniref:PilZ domain-containing protein n=1 Tax=Sphingopyxis sp. JAI128 TaxID=2723066 RepID=UPI0016098EFB|nr:PilZ domain-containing protein [Sphingopyxis sp. JAI128]MBB6428145.1 hypothetical protein [Sphingopyxis sp. JAI128]
MNSDDIPDRENGRIPEVDIREVHERRGSSRYRAIRRIARVTRNDDDGLWLVRNISDDGLQLAANVSVTVGEAVAIALSETISVHGRIVWAQGGRCGVIFDGKIDAAATLKALASEQRAEGYRALRLPIEAEAIMILRDGSHPIDLVDISQQGAGYVCDALLKAGHEIDLVLPGGEQRRRALIRWSRGKRGGLWFTQPLDRMVLESIARFGDVAGVRTEGSDDAGAFASSTGAGLTGLG